MWKLKNKLRKIRIIKNLKEDNLRLGKNIIYLHELYGCEIKGLENEIIRLKEENRKLDNEYRTTKIEAEKWKKILTEGTMGIKMYLCGDK